MSLRDLVAADAATLAALDVGAGGERWLQEVREIVGGLLAWRDDPGSTHLDRQVVVLDRDGEIVAVAAHEATQTESGMVVIEHRYLMVTAVTASEQRNGLARLLVTSIIDDIRRQGGRTVVWLVHPANSASVAFSRRTFPDAEETSPPEDKPFLAFTLYLAT